MNIEKIYRLFPWLLGAGVAAGSILLSTNCTVPKVGKCGGCGSCIVPLASIVSWALYKGRGKDPVSSKP